jgi:hypothetical protein
VSFTSMGDVSVGEMDDPVGHAADRDVVGDDQRGGADLLIDRRQSLQHTNSGLGIERSGRLVAQEDFRTLGDGSADRHTLLFSPGQLGGEMIVPIRRQPGDLQCLAGGHRVAGDFRHERDILERGQARHQIVELKHEAHMVAPVAGQLAVAPAGEFLVP